MLDSWLFLTHHPSLFPSPGLVKFLLLALNYKKEPPTYVHIVQVSSFWIPGNRTIVMRTRNQKCI